MRKDQGWVTKGRKFCGFFPKDGTSKTESLLLVWDLGTGVGVGPPRSTDSALQQLLPPAQPGQGLGVLFICIWIAMVFVCLTFSLTCSQAKCHRHYHTPSCSDCEVDKNLLGLEHPPRGARMGGGSFKEKPFQAPRQC